MWTPEMVEAAADLAERFGPERAARMISTDLCPGGLRSALYRGGTTVSEVRERKQLSLLDASERGKP